MSANNSKRAGLPWALVPVALLLSSALGVGSMAFIATRDPHFAIETDYYQKAIRWDEAQSQAAVNRQLGYVIELPAVIAFDSDGRVTLDLSIRDAHGQPVTGVRLTGNAFANAYSAKLVRLQFEEQLAGHYRAQISVNHRGQWVFQLIGKTQGQSFTSDVRADLVPGGSA